MNKTNDFTARKMMLVCALLCMTSFLVVGTVFNFKTFAIKFDNHTVMVKTIPSVTQEEVFFLADVDLSFVDMSEITVDNENYKEYTVLEPFSVTVMVDGEVYTKETLKTTLNDVLNELEIKLSSADIISMSPEQILMSDTQVKITRVTYEQSSITEYIDYATIRRETTTLSYGETRVVTDGEQGERVTISQTVLYDGEQVNEYIVSDEVLKLPVTHVIEYGTFNINRGVTVRDGVITTDAGQMLTYSKVIEGEATAYTTERQTNKITKTGTVAKIGTVAVDPRVIPLGSTLYITSADGTSWAYGVAVAEDTGGAVVGNIVDLFFNTYDECIKFGRQSVMIYVLS